MMPTTADPAHGSRAVFRSRVIKAAPEVLRYGQECAVPNEMPNYMAAKIHVQFPSKSVLRANHRLGSHKNRIRYEARRSFCD